MALSDRKISPKCDILSSESIKTLKPSRTVPSSFFKYNMAIHETLGSRSAALLFSALEYRFRKYPLGFYKFMSPSPNNIFYRKGDSLCEELSLSHVSIVSALKAICRSYKSKTRYLEAVEKLGEIGAFEGKPYLSYYDRKSARTFYLREYKAVEKVLNGTYKFDIYITKLNVLDIKKTLCLGTKETLCLGTKETLCLESVKHAENIRETRPSEKTIQRIPLSLSLSRDNRSRFKQPEEKNKKNKLRNTKQPSAQMETINDMVENWRQVTNRDLDGPIKDETVNNLAYAYHQIFSGSINNWREYCLLVSSSKYLMGETPQAFKLKLSWACKPDSIEKIMTGHFTTGDRKNMIYYDLEPITDSDPIILKFKLLCLEKLGKPRYVSWIKPLRISLNHNNEIVCNAPNDWFARHLSTNDFLGFSMFISELPIGSIIFKNPKGEVTGQIVSKNAN